MSHTNPVTTEKEGIKSGTTGSKKTRGVKWVETKEQLGNQVGGGEKGVK